MRSTLALLLFLAASGCAAPKYLARVDGNEITGADLKREFKRRHAGHESFLADERSIRSFVEKVVDYKLLAQEGYRLGLDEDPQIKATVQRYRSGKMLGHLARIELDEKIEVTPAEVQAIYDSKLSDLLNVRQLIVPSRDEAEAVRAQAAAGADFETLVRERSTSESRKRGGHLEVGWGAMPPEWEAAVFALPDDGLSPVLESEGGFEIVKVLKHVPLPKKPDFDVARPRIKSILESRKRQELKVSLARALWARYQVKLEPFDDAPEALRAVAASAPPSTACAATWAGGQLLVAEFARTLKVDELATMPPDLARRSVRQALENHVDTELLTLEAEARRYGELPQIAEQVTAYRDALVENKLEGDFLAKGVEATGEEARRYYEAHEAELIAPEERRIAQVVVATPEKAEEVEKKLAAGDAFEELARAYSTDSETAKRGGVIGWVKRDQATGDLAAVFELPQGGTSKAIRSSFGLHFFRIVEIKPARPRPFEEVEAECRKNATSEKLEAKRADWVKRLRASSRIEVSDAGIRRFVKDNPLPDKLAARMPKHAGMGMGGGTAAGTPPASGGPPATEPAAAPAPGATIDASAGPAGGPAPTTPPSGAK